MIKLIFATLVSCTFVLLSRQSYFAAAQVDGEEETEEYLKPTVVVAVLVRNKAHLLPWFLGQVELLDYPKDRITLW